MSRILARLVLAASAILAAPVVLILAFIPIESVMRNDDQAFANACILAAAFFITAWLLVWRTEVNWTPARRALTILSVIWSVLIAAIIATFVILTMRYRQWDLAVVIGAMVWIVIWIPSTALVWRETNAERAARLGRYASQTLPCPECGYNLVGLRDARCPECGAQYTLDQLFGAVAHPDKDLPDNTPESRAGAR